jgi:peroxiredoxin
MVKVNYAKFRGVWSHTGILTILLICSVALNVMLARKTSRLQGTLDTIESGKKLLPGSPVPPLELTSLEGSPAKISYADANVPTVLYVFSTSCVWCARNSDNIKFLTDRLKNSYRFVGVSLDRDVKEPGEYASNSDLPFPVYHTPSPSAWQTYKLGGTPQTIVISPEGKILDDWSGAYTQDTKVAVETFFKISLPGIKPVSVEGLSETIH